MATEQYIQEPVLTTFHSGEEEASEDKQKTTSAALRGSENMQSGVFECNICLGFVQDPVVSFCGHLYCWPCIYKWINLQSVSGEDMYQQQPQCPVCKADISQKTLVPLYGRGQTTNLLEGKARQVGIVIPQRPSILRCESQNLIRAATHQQNHNSYPQQLQSQHRHVTASPMINHAGTATANVFNPTIGMFGEMVYARIFGNSQTTLYAYPSSFHLEGSSPRARRLAMEADKSLGRICFFLCCCTVLCLLLF